MTNIILQVAKVLYAQCCMDKATYNKLSTILLGAEVDRI